MGFFAVRKVSLWVYAATLLQGFGECLKCLLSCFVVCIYCCVCVHLKSFLIGTPRLSGLSEFIYCTIRSVFKISPSGCCTCLVDLWWFNIVYCRIYRYICHSCLKGFYLRNGEHFCLHANHMLKFIQVCVCVCLYV